ncbi:MAG: alpha/beta hydrolase family protein [Novosphingobium sp.]
MKLDRAAIFCGTILAMLAASASAQPASPSAAAPAPVSAIPVEAFARIPFVDNARLSPDGRSMAGLLGVQGQQIISIYNLFDKSAKRVNTLLPEGTEAAWIGWVNDDNVIVGLRALLPVVDERWVISRLIGINARTGKITKILWNRNGQNAADVLWIASDGSPNILVAANNSIYLDEHFWPDVLRVDVATGKSSQVVAGREGVSDWYADSAGQIRAGVSYDDSTRKFRLLYRGEGSSGNFRTIDVADSRKQEGLVSPFLFMPGSDHALAIHDDDKGMSAIYEVDLTTQADVRTVHTAPPGVEVTSAILSQDGQTLLGARHSGNAPPNWFDHDLAAIQDSIDKSIGSRRARIVSLSADRSRMLIMLDRADSPGALYYFDINGEKMQQLAPMNPDLGTRPLSPVRMVRYTARDGKEIEAVLTVPRGLPEKSLPIVMMPHGGPWARDTLDYDYWAQFVASRGYVVMQPNFRGSTGYGTEFLRAGQGQMGLAMQDDISDGLAWAVKQGIADPKRACIVGASYGGYAAMWGVAKDPDQYRCAISIAGVANLRREVNDFGDSLFGGKYKDDWKRMTPDFAAVSPVNAIARIKAPLLLIHGKKDITVDISQSQSMYGKAKAAGKAVELVVLSEADHSFSREADRIVLLRSIDDFLRRNNPAGPSPAKP